MAALAAFDFLNRPPRTAKPRKRELSVVSVKCKSLAQAADIIETLGDIIDHMKLPDHVGIMWRNPSELTRAKTALYNKAGIDTFPGGIPFQVAAVEGKEPHFMGRIAGLDFKGVEVSKDSIELAPVERIAAIKCAQANGLVVYTELRQENAG